MNFAILRANCYWHFCVLLRGRSSFHSKFNSNLCYWHPWQQFRKRGSIPPRQAKFIPKKNALWRSRNFTENFGTPPTITRIYPNIAEDFQKLTKIIRSSPRTFAHSWKFREDFRKCLKGIGMPNTLQPAQGNVKACMTYSNVMLFKWWRILALRRG